MVLFKDNDDDARDRLTFKFVGGTEAELTVFGDPSGATVVRLCVYVNDVLTGSAILPPVTNWEARSTKFQYQDKAATVESITKVKLQAGAPGTPKQTKVRFAGKGANLPNPDVPIVEPYTLTVQVTNSTNNNCWGDWYTTANQVKNEAGIFKATKK